MEALRHAQFTRAWVDAIAVGSETVLVDDPLLTARDVFRERPLTRIVFDRRLRLRSGARLLSTLASGPVVVVTAAENLQRLEADVLRAAGAFVLGQPTRAIGDALALLPDLGVQSVLVEGGAMLQAALWDAGLVDYVQLYEAPRRFESAGVPLPRPRAVLVDGLIDRRVTPLGPDVLTEGYVHRPC
jgi:diaminohydroxyphosphoribosylaminopyrimidine deaminase/5-amino-6-(5-phosphoribosylamino)uracil reductase